MDGWIFVAGAVALVALGAPLVKKRMSKRESVEDRDERRKRQRAVVEELDHTLSPLLGEGTSGPIRIGPGSEMNDAYLVVRRKIRDEFRSSTGMHFDREFGYSLNRPGTVVPATPQLVEQIQRGRAVLLAEIEE
jgi:hypothetical protein